ncbi:hypothetical protein [Streptomyces sp. NPDC048332]|uniref:hypothetical protein n=1 Tax=Streptomyces sp. NPDC048332 TaxID=3154619 RepID=UPI0034409B6E
MTAPRNPPIKSIQTPPTGPRIAEPAPGTSGSGAPKVVGRQAVPTAVRPDPDVITVTGIWPGLQIRMTGIPQADWLCHCGHHERARGRTAVIELTTRVRVGHCPHTTPTESRRTAA